MFDDVVGGWGFLMSEVPMYSPNLFWHGRTNFDCVNFDGVNFCDRSMVWWQAFFEEKLEKIRKNLLGPPSGKVSSYSITYPYMAQFTGTSRSKGS